MLARPYRLQSLALIAFAGLCLAGTTFAAEEEFHISKSGLQWLDTKVGTGASPERGQTCRMLYTGWLYENGKRGKKFDSATFRLRPFEFQIGMGKVIEGWDEGVATMKVGGKRTLIVPAELGYGKQGAGRVIPPNATLLFEVELLGVK